MPSTNEGLADRLIRVLIGLALIAFVFVGPQTAWGWLGVIPLVTGLVGFCPVYRLFGISTCPASVEVEKTLKQAHLLGLSLLLAACHSLPSSEPGRSAASNDGYAFVQASCGECHAVGRYGTSRNSNAPPFPVIVNQEGVTAETLSSWLRGAHNYPREMDFYLDERKVDALVAYMLTLRDPNYKRPPD